MHKNRRKKYALFPNPIEYFMENASKMLDGVILFT